MQIKPTYKKYTARFLVLVAIISTAAACASGPYPVSSPYYQVPAGTGIELKQTLTITPNSGRVYVQYGKVVTPKERERYHANCWFLSWKVLETPQTIHPDTFIVKGSRKSQDIVQNQSAIKLASLDLQTAAGTGFETVSGKGIGFLANASPMAAVFTTTLDIRSDRQPDIRQLACSHWDDVSSGEHLTVEQMQQALGDIARIAIQ
jgi:hypothetical protein